MAQPDRVPPLAVRLTLAIVLAAGAVAFGIWATLVSNPNLFSRLVNLAVVWTGVIAVLGLAGTVATRPKPDAKAEPSAPAKAVPAESTQPTKAVTAELAQPGNAVPAEPTSEPHASPTAGPLNSGDVPREPPGFVTRPDLLGALDEPGAGGGVLVVRAVTGMRGVGKTQLAAAYARARRADKWRLVAWIDAETPGGLLDGLAQAADVIGLHVTDAEAAGRAVRHWLEADGRRCLLIFDNATEPDLIEPYVPSTGRATVIITSNQQEMANLGTAVPVDVFTARQAADYLADRTGLAGAAALAEELGYLPLALAQAAAVIGGQHLDYGTYLNRLRSTPVADLLGPLAASHCRHGAAAAILVASGAVAEADPSGACIGVMGLHAARPVPARRHPAQLPGRHGLPGAES